MTWTSPLVRCAIVQASATISSEAELPSIGTRIRLGAITAMSDPSVRVPRLAVKRTLSGIAIRHLAGEANFSIAQRPASGALVRCLRSDERSGGYLGEALCTTDAAADRSTRAASGSRPPCAAVHQAGAGRRRDLHHLAARLDSRLHPGSGRA